MKIEPRLKEKIKRKHLIILVLLVAGIAITILTPALADLISGDSGSDLVAHYRFDYGAKDTAYDTAGDNDGTINGATWVDGKFGKALDFDSANSEYVNVPDSPSLRIADGSFTVSAWVSLPSIEDAIHDYVVTETHVGGNKGWTLRDNNGLLKFYANDGTNAYGTSAGRPSTGEWHFVSVVVDRDTDKIKLYLDGELGGTDGISGAGSFEINTGVSLSQSSRTMLGTLDEVRIYDRALSQSEVKSLYNRGAAKIGNETEEADGKVLDIGFRKKNSTHVFDTSGNENHGLIQGPEQKTAVNCKVGRCYSFDGSGDYVDISGALGSWNSLTIGAWVKAPKYTGTNWPGYVGGTVSGAYNIGIGIWQDTNHQWLEVDTSDGNYPMEGNIDIPWGKWYYATLVYDGSSLTEYVNGIEGKSISASGALNSLQGLHIGHTQGSSGNHFDGKIDQVKIYDRALSQKEIIEEAGLKSDGAVLDMRLDAGGGDLAYDNSIHNNNGRLKPNESYGPTWTDGKVGKALEFDGSDDYIGGIYNKDLGRERMGDSGSIGVWVRPKGNGRVWEAEPKRPRLHYDYTNNRFQVYWFSRCSDAEETFGNSDAVYVSAEPYKWYHIFFTWNNKTGNWAVYKNGKLYDSGSDLFACQFGWSDGREFCFGMYCGHDTGYFNGTIDQAKVYSYPLSKSKIKQLYAQGSAKIGRGAIPESCSDISPGQESGVYRIDPNGGSPSDAFSVYCMKRKGAMWTRLNFLPDAHTGAKGAPFGDSDRGPTFGESTDVDQGNLGLVNSELDPDHTDAAFFQRDSNMRCHKYAIGNSTRNSFKGVTTGWDYYDAKGNPIPPKQIEALDKMVEGTYYNGSVAVNDIDGPFPNGGDGNGGENSFSIPVDLDATHSPTGGGPIALWFSTTPDLDVGTTHVLGSDYDSGSNLKYSAKWKPVNTMGIPMFFGGKVDNDANLYSEFSDADTNDCEEQAGSEFELENEYFWVKGSSPKKPVLNQDLDRVETCGQSDTLTCPSGMSGDIAVDQSGLGNHGELSGPTELSGAKCKKGKCLEFDGSDSLTIQDAASLDVTDITVGMWMKASSSEQYDGSGYEYPDIIEKTGVWRIEFWRPHDDNKLGFYTYNKSGTIFGARGSWSDGNWNYLTGTYDGSSLKWYINGDLVGETSVSGDLNTNNEDIIINEDGKVNVEIDEVRIYNRSLSKEEIWHLYTQGRDQRGRGEKGGPAGWWRMDDSVNFGDGSDGSLTVSSQGRIVNDYAYLIEHESPGMKTLKVDDASGFSAGDEIMIIQMQDGGGFPCEAGQYEFRQIQSIKGNTITLKKGLRHPYCYKDPEIGLPVNKYNPPAGDHTAAVAQVVSIPHYTDVMIQSNTSITAPYWNGSVGGIVAFRATGTITVNGNITVKGKGFRGGAVLNPGDDDDGGQGEGLTGLGIQGSGGDCDGRAAANGIGGGGSLCINNDGGDPGAAGGYGSMGEDASKDDSPCDLPHGGKTTGSRDLSEGLFFGGGGGGGSDSDDSNCLQNPFGKDPDGDPNSRPNLCQRGGHGGGIVYLAAEKIKGANISVEGHTTHPVFDGGPGGGAGGTIQIKTYNITIDEVNATGGPEVCDWKSGGADCGARGGDGRIRIDRINQKGSTDPILYASPFEAYDLAESNTGNLSGDPQWASGKVGKALDLDGSDDYVNVSDDSSLRLDGSLTVSAWVKSEMTSSFYDAFVEGESSATYYSWTLRVDDNLKPQFAIANGGWTGATAPRQLEKGRWTHLVGTYDSSTDVMKLYRNGDLVDQNTQSSRVAHDKGVVIGYYPYGGSYFNGKIDDVRIYPYALTKEQIESVYNLGAAKVG